MTFARFPIAPPGKYGAFMGWQRRFDLCQFAVPCRQRTSNNIHFENVPRFPRRISLARVIGTSRPPRWSFRAQVLLACGKPHRGRTGTREGHAGW